MHPNPHAFVLQRGRVERHARNNDAYTFFNLLTGAELFDKVESLLPEHRERLFPPTETLSIFLAQALSADRSCQKPGLGFPLCRLVGMVCLGSGAVLDAAMGPFRGKGGDERSLLRSILDTLARGDVLLGDAYYATYFLLCDLVARGIDAVFEQNGARQLTTDFRRGQRLGPRDSPDRFAKAGPQSDLKLLYASLWHVELDLRNIKTALEMERLSCLRPEMTIKEIWVYLLAYNLIRLMMAQAAQLAGCLPRQLSFKHTVQFWIAWDRHRPYTANDDTLRALFVLIAQQRVGDRLGRIEPWAVKRRPKPYPLLTKPRAIAREDVRK